MNVKHVYRLYIEERLMVRRRKRKRLVRERSAEPRLTGTIQEWAMDFIVDGLATGRMVRILSNLRADDGSHAGQPGDVQPPLSRGSILNAADKQVIHVDLIRRSGCVNHPFPNVR